MDMITLAMAKAYTNKKFGEGGGSGGGLTVIEIPSDDVINIWSEDEAALSPEVSAAFEAAAAAGMPIVVYMPFENGDILVTSVVCSYVGTLDFFSGCCFTLLSNSIEITAFRFQKKNNQWVAAVRYTEIPM